MKRADTGNACGVLTRVRRACCFASIIRRDWKNAPDTKDVAQNWNQTRGK
jgi:hypothetical protein